MSATENSLSVNLTDRTIQDVILEAVKEHNGPLSIRITDAAEAIQKSILTDVNQEQVRRAMVKAGRGVLKSITRKAVEDLETALLDTTGDNAFEVGLVFALGRFDSFPVRNEHFRFDTLESAQAWGQVQMGRSANAVFTGMSHRFAVAAEATVVDFFVTIISKSKKTDKARLEPDALDAMKNSVVLLRGVLEPEDVENAIVAWIENTTQDKGRTDRNLRIRVVMSKARKSIVNAILDTPAHLLFPGQPVNPEGITPAAAVEAMAALLDTSMWRAHSMWTDERGRSLTTHFGSFPSASLALRAATRNLEWLDKAPKGFNGIRLSLLGTSGPNDKTPVDERQVVLTLHADGPFA